ncbi:hypothetical protein C9374_001340 [Naegleria lovaniensis]|uniref:U1-type domain-containing protein n=1 Tax=Naegleria lovaniensis TaxID=51637 RepID=A0AA88KNM4_NAELO|nr:uncharacterized protein C9374_001340 [Naegleria lovaniensis]KAG2387746.1 hypothetical protein C9374_001340 [Naegleria lovaniensis]
MSTPSWKPKGNTFCKYCQQWIRDTPSEQKRHERSKHHVINVQNYIRNQQQQERNVEKEQQRNRKLLDNIEKRVSKNINNDESSNPYFQQFLKHQEEMQKIPLLPPPIHLISSQQPPQQQSELANENIVETEEKFEPESFEHNDLPLSTLVSSSDATEQKTSFVKSKHTKKSVKTSSAPAEIGGYYDDPNYFYYEQDDEEESKEESSKASEASEAIEQKQEANKDIPVVKTQTSSSWKNKYATSYSTSSNTTFGQWEVVSVAKREPVTSNNEASQLSFATSAGDNFKNDDSLTHEEDTLGGSYTHTDKKRKFNASTSADLSSTKKVKSEDSTQPKKPISFSLSRKK